MREAKGVQGMRGTRYKVHSRYETGMRDTRHVQGV